MEKTLTERRAEFVYNAARLAAEGANAPIIPVLWGEREPAFKEQFLKVTERQCGEQRSKLSGKLRLHGGRSRLTLSLFYTFSVTRYSR